MPIRAEHRERGATSIEYALLAMLIAMAIIATLILLGPVVASMFEWDAPAGP